MKKIRFLALAGLVAMATGACADLEVTNLNDPDRSRAISTPGDIEALISGSFSSWWGANHYNGPGPALSVAADDHTSSWGNFGMRDMGWEPRKAYDNDPSYSYSYANEAPWSNLYRALSGVRDGLIPVLGLYGTEQVEIGVGGADTERAIAFARFVQGMALGTLAQLFDQGFIVTEEPEDLTTLGLVSYTEIHAESQRLLTEAANMASSGSFTIPAPWVGDNGDWSSAYLARVARAFKARFNASVPRNETDRANAPWQMIMDDAKAALGSGDFEFATNYTGENWGWDRLKVHAGSRPIWARVDLRQVGPGDVSGNYQAWLAISNPEERNQFDVTSPDRRIHGEGDIFSNGLYHEHAGGSPFRPERGTYHFSPYRDLRWRELSDNGYVGVTPDFPAKELEFLIAEAEWRVGDKGETMRIVNKWRANGELPPFTDVNQVAPGGDQCVPRVPETGVCEDLFGALKYEKRMEVWHYGMGTAYFDDRGWGDLVKDTPIQLPIPGSELLLLQRDIYTFGGPGGDGAAPSLVNRWDPEAIRLKRLAYDRYDKVQQTDIDPGIIR